MGTEGRGENREERGTRPTIGRKGNEGQNEISKRKDGERKRMENETRGVRTKLG